MDDTLKDFYKFTTTRDINWNKDMTLYCVGLSCVGCVLRPTCILGGMGCAIKRW